MRGAPQSGFSMLIRRINTRRSVSICGRPPSERASNASSSESRPDANARASRDGYRENLEDRRKPSIQLDKEPAIVVREPDLALHLTPQNDQLMSECHVLCFKPALDLNGEAKTARTRQSSANIVHCAFR